MEDRDVPRPVVRDLALLRARQVRVDVALDLKRGAVQHPFVFQALADGFIDLGPQLVRGRQDRLSGAQIRIEVEPPMRRLPAELVALRLQDAVAKLLHRHAGPVRHHV